MLKQQNPVKIDLEPNSIMSDNKLKLAWCSHEAAKYSVETWHYSKCLPIGKLVKVGVWENDKFIGCIIYSRGTAKDLGTKYGLLQSECVELTRVALNKHINPVSKILAISFKFLKKKSPTLKMIVSFAAKSEGHHGGIYQATNWIYTGESAANSDAIYKGRRIPNRTIGGIKLKYKMTEKQLIDNGILTDIRRMTKHRYLMPLDNGVKDSIIHLSKKYPKRVTKANSSDQLECGGAVPTYTL